MKIPSRQHRRIKGHRIPMGVVMSYQILWRRWLTRIHAEILHMMLAEYRRKMGKRVDAKYKSGFTHETYVSEVDEAKVRANIEKAIAAGKDPTKVHRPQVGTAVSPHKSEKQAFLTAEEHNLARGKFGSLYKESGYKLGVREIGPGSPHAIEAAAKHTTHAIGAKDLKIVTEEVFHDPALTTEIRVLAARVNKQNAIDFRRVVGINLHTEQGIDSAIEGFRERNISLFSTLADDERDRMGEILDEAERSGLRVEELAGQLQDEFDVTKSKADFWARDQVLKLNGQLTQQRQTNAGIEKYIWTTSGDERVRETHAELDGTVQSWNDPPIVSEDGSTGNPGDDYQCRCTAFPILDELEDTE